MKKLLYISFLLIIGVSIFSLYRFGPTFERFLKGDGNAVLEAASALIGIWALVVGFSATIIGATFELSKLPSHWKLKLLRTQISKRLTPFIIHTLICGILPFIAILNIDVSVGVYESPVSAWLILVFVLQILLILSAAKAAFLTYEKLTLIPAIKMTLERIGADKFDQLKKLDAEAFNADLAEKQREGLIPMSGFGRSLSGEYTEIHEELLTLFVTLFRETNPQILDEGVRAISEWAKDKPIKEIDSYLQNRLIPSLFHMMRTDQATFLPAVFKSRLFYFARLIIALKESGAILTALNVANPLWEIISEYARNASMSEALDMAEMAINPLLSCEEGSILLGNLSCSISPLVAEKSPKSIFWIEKILEWHRLYIEAMFRNWPNMREQSIDIINKMENIYECVEKAYGSKSALFAGIHDMRYWVLIIIRQIQEAFVASIPPDKIKVELKKFAADDFDYFDQVINRLLDIRKPDGNPASYAAKYKNNPYQEKVNS